MAESKAAGVVQKTQASAAQVCEREWALESELEKKGQATASVLHSSDLFIPYCFIDDL